MWSVRLCVLYQEYSLLVVGLQGFRLFGVCVATELFSLDEIPSVYSLTVSCEVCILLKFR